MIEPITIADYVNDNQEVLNMTLITDEVLQRHYKAASIAGCNPSIVDDPEYRATLERVLSSAIGVAHRATKHNARNAFNRGQTIAISARGHQTSFDVYPTTTVHTNTSTDWASLERQVADWSNRYPNQRFYIIEYHNHPRLLARICDAVTELDEPQEV